MATKFQTPMDTLLPNQGLDGGNEDPNRKGGGGGGKGKTTRGHAVEGNTDHSIKIADAVAAFMKAHGKKGKGGQKLTFSGFTKGSGTPYKTSSEHRDHSKKWHSSKKSTVEDRRRTVNGMLSKNRQITEAQVTQVSGKVSTIALFDGIIAQLAVHPARKATSIAGMAADDGIGTDEGTTAPTHGPGDGQVEETEDRDEEGDEDDDDEDNDEDDDDDDEEAVNALIAELQAIANGANPPHKSSEDGEL